MPCVAHRCFIEGSCFEDGDLNPAPAGDFPGDFACQVCDSNGDAACSPADTNADCVARFEWTLLDGIPCDDYDETTHTDMCHNGACYGTFYDGSEGSAFRPLFLDCVCMDLNDCAL